MRKVEFPENMETSPESDDFEIPTNRISRWLIVSASVVFLCGVLAIVLPFTFSVGIAALLGCLLLVAGAAHVVFGINFEGAHWAWHVVIALGYALVALNLMANPLLGIVLLALIVGVVLIAEGLIEIVLFFLLREYRHAVWILIDGVITLALGVIACAHWPPDTPEVVQYLVGIAFILSGISRLLLSIALHELGPAKGAIGSPVARGTAPQQCRRPYFTCYAGRFVRPACFIEVDGLTSIRRDKPRQTRAADRHRVRCG